MLEPEIVYRAFPGSGPSHRRAILREYLQLKALDFIFGRLSASGLVFTGGTCIHIFHGSDRFSEDLDFDNRGLTGDLYADLAGAVAREFRLEGVACECTVKAPRGASTATLRFGDILQAWKLTPHKDEILRLKLDAAPQEYDCPAEVEILNRLDVICGVPVLPAGLLLSNKLIAILERNRLMGRDLYDAAYLFGMTAPDLRYIEEKSGLSTPQEVAGCVMDRIGRTDMGILEEDVRPFVAFPGNLLRISAFPEILSRWASEAGDRSAE
ncbi:MAG: nucleotidyl transferase AbiEii/AbiGii toxin family protein [Candidatus Fermentibacter sp.]|nr:nucleotidyl transferase AbiEii/AbiGii toxin family protein [Candidatus Fermentibacter sp.]